MEIKKMLEKLQTFTSKDDKVINMINQINDFGYLEKFDSEDIYREEANKRQLEILEEVEKSTTSLPDWFLERIDSGNIPERHLLRFLKIARKELTDVSIEMNPNGPGISA